MTDPKSRLQHIYQVNTGCLPQYNTTKCIISTGAPSWVSYLLYKGERFTSTPQINKKTAEFDVARIVLQHIDESIKRSMGEYDDKTVLLVDVENLHTFIHHLNIKNLKIYAFVGRYHERVSDKYHLPVEKIISPSSRTDGTDACMQVYVGMLLVKTNYETYLIATKDRFGAALVDIIEGFGKKAKLIVSPDDINK